MPVKGWINNVRLPRIGKIHLGVKQGQPGKQYPKAVDYFVVKADESTSPAAAKAFADVYGEEPREIDVMFPSDDVETFFRQDLASYYRTKAGASDLFCKGDGERAVRSTEAGRVEMPCLYQECPIYASGKCSEIGRLQFLLPKVKGLGVWQIDTGSFHSVSRLMGSIQMLQAVTGGRIRMIPLKLRVTPLAVSPDGKPKTVYVMDLGVEDMKLEDFLHNVVALPAASPQVEAINVRELPEDLRVEADLVDEADLDVLLHKEPDGLSVSEPLQQDEPIPGAFVDVRVKKDAGGPIAKIRIAIKTGETLELFTRDTAMMADAKRLEAGQTVRFAYQPGKIVDGKYDLTRLATGA